MAAHAFPLIPAGLDFHDDEKPYVESVHGRLARKVSPRRTHGRLQLRMARWLEDWAGQRGEVAAEWRFYLVRGGLRPSSLVPDVAYVSYARLPLSLPEDARERPRLAPDIAVEIWSPNDRTSVLGQKIGAYLSHGATVVIVVYPKTRNVVFHTQTGASTHQAVGALAVPGYDDLVLEADRLFSGL
jgi:Uma2 family endonuclease